MIDVRRLIIALTRLVDTRSSASARRYQLELSFLRPDHGLPRSPRSRLRLRALPLEEVRFRLLLVAASLLLRWDVATLLIHDDKTGGLLIASRRRPPALLLPLSVLRRLGHSDDSRIGQGRLLSHGRPVVLERRIKQHSFQLVFVAGQLLKIRDSLVLYESLGCRSQPRQTILLIYLC